MTAPRWGIFGIDTGRAVWCTGRGQAEYPQMGYDNLGVHCPACKRYVKPKRALWTDKVKPGESGYPSVIRWCQIPAHKRLPEKSK